MIMKNLVSLFVVLVALVTGLSAQSVIRFTAQDNLGQSPLEGQGLRHRLLGISICGG